MEMIARQADDKTREGSDLAQRGAYFAARADFVAALRVLAQGLDNEEGAARHSQALGAALTAMKEVQDFVPAPGKVEGELELAPIVAAHRTPLLKNVPPERLQALGATKLYFNFAQQQLCLAAGREVAGSMALRALGKLHAAMAERAVPEVVLPEAQAITFLQAAILVCPPNYMAANDLGVLLAHKGDFAAALAPLEHSVRVCPCSENLSNLSAVYRRLGNVRMADIAARDAESAKARELARQRSNNRFAGGSVQWVDASVMARPSGQWTDMPVRPAASAASGPGAAAGPGVAQQPSQTGSPMIR
jgi:tetratricopeptide (TPR) repeat protein